MSTGSPKDGLGGKLGFKSRGRTSTGTTPGTSELEEVSSAAPPGGGESSPPVTGMVVEEVADVELGGHRDRHRAVQLEYQQVWAAAQPAIDAVAAKVAENRYGKPPLGNLFELVNTFSGAKKRMQDAVDAGNYPAAIDACKQAKNAGQNIETEFTEKNEAARNAYAEARARIQARLDTYNACIADKKYGDPVQNHFAPAVELYLKQVKNMEDNAAAGIFTNAAHLVKSIETIVFKQLKSAVGQFGDDWNKVKESADKISTGIAAGAYDEVPTETEEFKHSKAEAVNLVALTASPNFEFAAAYEAIDDLKSAATALQAAAVAALRDPRRTSPKGATQAKIVKLLKADPDVLKAAAATDGGPEWIDALVADVGAKAKDDISKKFVEEAITARFGPKLTGDNAQKGGRYLVRLYDVLGKVPASHTKGNEMMQSIERERGMIGTSTYMPGMGAIKLKLRTGALDTLAGSLASTFTSDLYGFDFVTLHEVGHSVDDNKGQFMNTNGSNPLYGGWQKHTVQEVAEIVRNGKSFQQDFRDLSPGFLDAYLVAVLSKKAPGKETAVREHADAPPSGDRRWTALGKHNAVKFCENIRMKSASSGLWDGDPMKYVIGDRIYQETYPGTWESYLASARTSKVTNYQFRAAGEWYAEAYACFFTGRLPETHPLYALLKADVDAEA